MSHSVLPWPIQDYREAVVVARRARLVFKFAGVREYLRSPGRCVAATEAAQAALESDAGAELRLIALTHGEAARREAAVALQQRERMALRSTLALPMQVSVPGIGKDIGRGNDRDREQPRGASSMPTLPDSESKSESKQGASEESGPGHKFRDRRRPRAGHRSSSGTGAAASNTASLVVAPPVTIPRILRAIRPLLHPTACAGTDDIDPLPSIYGSAPASLHVPWRSVSWPLRVRVREVVGVTRALVLAAIADAARIGAAPPVDPQTHREAHAEDESSDSGSDSDGDGMRSDEEAGTLAAVGEASSSSSSAAAAAAAAGVALTGASGEGTNRHGGTWV